MRCKFDGEAAAPDDDDDGDDDDEIADVVCDTEKSESSLLSFLAGLRRSGNARFVRRTSGSS